MSEPSRVEKMVGTLLGLRMIVAQLLAVEAGRSGDAEGFVAELRRAALEMLETWPIGSDTPESAAHIRHCAVAMVGAFPQPPALPALSGTAAPSVAATSSGPAIP